MPKYCHSGIRPLLFHQARQKSEVVVLCKQNRTFGWFHFFQYCLSELEVDCLVLFPIGRPEDRTSVGNVTEGPESFVRESIVIAGFLFFAQPYPAQSVAGL